MSEYIVEGPDYQIHDISLPGPQGASAVETWQFTQTGTARVQAGTGVIPVLVTTEILEVLISVATPPTGSPVIADLLVTPPAGSPVSIFPTTGQRPSVLPGQSYGAADLTGVALILPGSLVEGAIVSVGSTFAGEVPIVHIRARRL